MFRRCLSSFPNVYCNTSRLPVKRLLLCASAFKSDYKLFPTDRRLARHFSMIGDGLTQHETQSAVHANGKLVGQSGRHYVIKRVLQSKEVPPSRVYLTE